MIWRAKALDRKGREEDPQRSRRKKGERQSRTRLTGELAEEFLLVHAILEGLAAIDEDDRDFVVELAAKFEIGIDVDFAPRETAAPREFAQTFFHDFAEMTTFAGVNDDAAGLWHVSGILRGKIAGFQEQSEV